MEKDLFKRRQQICDRFNELADKREKGELTESEKLEREALERELESINMRIKGMNGPQATEPQMSREAATDKFLRECMNKGGKQEFALQREAVKTTDVDATIPLTVEDIMKPLEEGLILDKVGLKLKTGLAGKYSIPQVSYAEASVAGEAEKVNETDFDFTKIEPSPKRVCIVAKVSNQTIIQSLGSAYNAIVEQLSAGIRRVLNRRMFTTSQSVSDALIGPFKTIAAATGVAAANIKTIAQKKAAKKILFAGELPTWKELILLRSIAMVKGIEPEFGCYIMDAATKGELEATTKDAGSGRFIIENGMIDGYPVFCTNFINTGTKNYVGFGFWGYEALGQFGNPRMTVDPVSCADEDVVKIVFNSDWAMNTLRPEAFTLGQCAGGGSGSGSGE